MRDIIQRDIRDKKGMVFCVARNLFGGESYFVLQFKHKRILLEGIKRDTRTEQVDGSRSANQD